MLDAVARVKSRHHWRSIAGTSSIEDAPRYPRDTLRGAEGPVEPSRDGLPNPEVLLAFAVRTGEDAAAGFKDPHHQGKRQQPAEDNASGSPGDEDNAQEKDHCRLLTQGIRNQEEAPL
ncbi:hypothetical protein NDU88_005451 [Pleurodeles waltl]|uniref:Uncharacterized protein n=1 Tax=Pleurodeles waltl TaxID=8319 RepID=A0AAV7LL57_PLEWA|nr:hypothetical protein NDU88_005451 [Pleurodeles waltl]